MKLPAVAMAALFACGIALGLCPPIARHASSRFFLLSLFISAGILSLSGFMLAIREKLPLAAASAMLCWVLLGIAGAVIAEQPLPSNHVIALVESGRLDLHSPLKWFGRLRDEPAKLPWGYGYEIELSGVRYRGELLSLLGGLRLNFAPRPDEQAPTGLHAGDEVGVLTQARRPPVFRDRRTAASGASRCAHGVNCCSRRLVLPPDGGLELGRCGGASAVGGAPPCSG